MRCLSLDGAFAETASGEGRETYALMEELFRLARCIAGSGLRATVQRLGQAMPFRVTEVQTGTRVFDWTLPEEWSISEANLEHESRRGIADFRNSNLHSLRQSMPMRRTSWATAGRNVVVGPRGD